MSRRWGLRAAAALFVLWAVTAGFLLYRSAGDVRAGRDAATRARAQLDLASLTSGGPAFELDQAAERFGRAERTTGGVLLAPVRLLPIAGRQVRSVHALSAAAATVGATGADALRRVTTVLDEPSGAGPQRVEQLRTLSEVVGRASKRVEAIGSLGPAEGLIGPLHEARREVAEQLAEVRQTLRDASIGTRAATELLAGPKRYLLIAANNAEMRAGSGMWLSGGLLRTAGGRFDLGPVAPLALVGDPPNGAVAVTDADLQDRWGFTNPAWDFRNLMTSPRFPVAAALASQMWEAGGQEPVDGVLVVDPIAVRAVVRTVGAVTVGGRTFDGDSIVAELLNGQYTTFADSVGQDDRRDVLAEVARTALAALDRGGWSVNRLASELGEAARGRHLLLWAKEDRTDEAWQAAGVSGELGEGSLMLSVLNRAGNKMDWFLPAEGSIATESTDAGTEVTVKVGLRNTAPAKLPRYVGGPPPVLDYPSGTYRGIVALNVPGAATDIVVEGFAQPLVAGPDGVSQVVGVPVEVLRGNEATFVVRFRLPGRSGSLVVEPSARVPGVRWSFGGKRWEDSGARTVNW